MKKLLSLMLAMLLLVSVCAGCGSKDNSTDSSDSASSSASSSESTSGDSTASTDDSLLTVLTGIKTDDIVATIGEVEVPADAFFYWLSYNCSALESQAMMYAIYYDEYAHMVNDEGAVNWEGLVNDSQTLSEYAMEQTKYTAVFYAAIEELAREHGIVLTSEDEAYVKSEQDALREEMGSAEIYDAYLKIASLREDTLSLISSTARLYDKLLESVITEGSPLYLESSAYDEMATYADHILLATIDLSTGAALSDTEIAAKRATAENILAQLRASNDPVALFSQLADQFSEDTGRASNPTGYIYTPGTMVSSFEDAAAALKVGEISDIVESEYGYHILLRRDLAEGLAADPEQLNTLADTYLNQLLMTKMQELPLSFSEVLDTLDVANYYMSSAAAIESFQSQLEASSAG